MRALMMTTVISGWVLASATLAAPPTGAYVFDSSPKYPDFTRVVISEANGKLTGTITSRWYGDLPMKDLRADGDKLIFQIYNGNPRLKPEDIASGSPPGASGTPSTTPDAGRTSASAVRCFTPPTTSR